MNISLKTLCTYEGETLNLRAIAEKVSVWSRKSSIIRKSVELVTCRYLLTKLKVSDSM